MCLNTQPNPETLDSDSGFESRKPDSVSRLESTPGTGTPNPDPRCEPESGLLTLEKIINALYCDHNVYTKTISSETTAQDCSIWKNINCF